MDLLDGMNSDIGRRIVPVIGEMHVHAHERLCQILLNPKMIVGTGLCECEAAERIWSRSGKYHHIVKEMAPDTRREQLDDHFQHEFNLNENDMR